VVVVVVVVPFFNSLERLVCVSVCFGVLLGLIGSLCFLA
jgi:hypothetical protein